MIEIEEPENPVLVVTEGRGAVLETGREASAGDCDEAD